MIKSLENVDMMQFSFFSEFSQGTNYLPKNWYIEYSIARTKVRLG